MPGGNTHNSQAAKPADRKPSEVIYQIYPASFADSDGDGQGDLKGITGKLGYVAKLGVDSIWISPFYPSPPGPDGDGGYAVSDYRGVDPKFGTMQDFKDMLAEAHAKGLRVYIDFVLAHTANTHEWFEKSVRREKGFEDRFVWHDGWKDQQGNRYPPNNWKSVFGGPAWEFSQERGQWYLHHFLKSQPALNLNRTDVQDAILDEMKFWLDLGVDGFRLDALPFCNYDSQFRHNPWRDGKWPRPTENWDEQYFAHSICQPQTVDLVHRIKQLLKTYPGERKALGEAIAGRDGGGNSIPVAAEYAQGEYGLDMCYTEALMSVHEYPGAARMREMVNKIEQHFAGGGNCNAASNHDMPRSATRLADKLPSNERGPAMRQLLKLFLTMPGSFCMYQGEELGLPQAHIPLDIPAGKLRDPVSFTRGIEHSRDGSRTPMPWKKGALQAGFTAAANPYLPVPASHYALAADAQESDSASMLNETRRLLAWRKAQPALIDGSARALDLPEPALGILRENDQQTLLCLYNMSGHETRVKIGAGLSDDQLARLGVARNTEVTLPAYGSCNFGERPAQRRVPGPAPKQQ